eukprot:m.27320 g.27320  ORF g.27320 m.27320 type:complete len:1538 (-) comp9006_c1_seq1:23-4636(-)
MELDNWSDHKALFKAAAEKPASFVVLGKPKSGKTFVAQQIAAILHKELVSVPDLLNQAVIFVDYFNKKKAEEEEKKKAAEGGEGAAGDEEREAEDNAADEEEEPAPAPPGYSEPTSAAFEAVSALRRGEVAPHAAILQLVLEKLASPEVAFKGCVLDSLPVDWTSAGTAAAQLDQFLKSWRPDYAVTLEMSDADVLARLAGMRTNTTDGAIYAKAQLDLVPPPPKKEGEEEEEEDEPSQEEENPDGELAERPEEPRRPSYVLPAISALDSKLTATLVLPVESFADSPCPVAALLAAYPAVIAQISSALQAVLLPGHALTLHAVLPQVDLVADLVTLLDGLTRTRLPIALDGLEDDVADEAQLFEELCKQGVEDEEEPFIVGPYRTCCPVTFLQTGLLKRGSAQHAAVYFNNVFLFASREYRDTFLRNPHLYLTAPPSAPCRVFLAGPASPRISALAARLATRAGIEVIDGSGFRQPVAAPPALAPGAVPVITDDAPPPPPIHPAVVACTTAVGDRAQFVVSCFPADPAHVEAIGQVGLAVLLVYVEAVGGEAETEAESRLRGSVEHSRAGLSLKAPAATDPDALAVADEQAVVAQLNILLKFPAVESMHQIEESLSTKQGLGVTGRFCPVALHTNFVLFPGANDASATYHDFNYHFSTEEARTAFYANPSRYVTPGVLPEVPPPRILVLGAGNSGKTIQCRKLVRRTRLFHMSFHERLKEMSVLLGGEHGDTIKTHLADPTESPLPPDVALAVVQKLWTEEPYRSTGFVLEGFPRNEEEARALFEAGLYPDCVVDLTMSTTAAIKRSLPGKLVEFRKTRAAVLAQRKAEEEAKVQKLKDHRAAWEKAQADKRAEKEAKRQQMGDEYESDGEEEEEYVEPEDDEDAGSEEALETEQAATDRFKEEITTSHELVIEGIKALTDLLREEYRLPQITIDADMRDVAVWDTLERSLRKFISNRGNLLLHPYALTSKSALTLLRRGNRRLSVFGEWCPVRLASGCPVLYSPRGRYPVCLFNTVFFLSSKEARIEFLSNPLRYLLQPGPPTTVPTSLAIFGPPKSGKSTLARRVELEYGMVRVSAGSSLRAVLAQERDSVLAHEIDSVLRSGAVVPEALVADAIAAVCSRAVAQTRGFVLDGYPQTEAQRALLAARGVTVRRVIELTLDDAHVLARAVADAAKIELHVLPLFDSPDIQQGRLAVYRSLVPPLLAHYATTLHIHTPLDAMWSKWRLWSAVSALVETSVKQMQALRTAQTHRGAVAIDGLGVASDVIVPRLSPFGLYCPVTWALRREFVRSDIESRAFVAEFFGAYYYLADRQALDAFLASPVPFTMTPPPTSFPLERSAAEVKALFPKQVELGGCCPVTYVTGQQQYDSLRAGSPDHVVEYAGKLYSCLDDEKRSLFLRCPDRYLAFTPPKKYPPKVTPMNTTTLPMLGYMEQTVAAVITKALTAVGLARPVHPHMTPSQSAMIFVALYVKAHNPKGNDRTRMIWRQRLKKFEERCAIVEYLGTSMAASPAEPRALDIDAKIKVFSSLQRPITPL